MVIPLLENNRKNRPKWHFHTSKIHYPTGPTWNESIFENGIDSSNVTYLLSSASALRVSLAQEAIISGIGSAQLIYEILNIDTETLDDFDEKQVESYDSLVTSSLSILSRNETLMENLLRYSIWRLERETQGFDINTWRLIYNLAHRLKRSPIIMSPLLGKIWSYEYKPNNGFSAWHVAINCDEPEKNECDLFTVPKPAAIESKRFAVNPLQGKLSRNLMEVNRFIAVLETMFPTSPQLVNYH